MMFVVCVEKLACLMNALLYTMKLRYLSHYLLTFFLLIISVMSGSLEEGSICDKGSLKSDCIVSKNHTLDCGLDDNDYFMWGFDDDQYICNFHVTGSLTLDGGSIQCLSPLCQVVFHVGGNFNCNKHLLKSATISINATGDVNIGKYCALDTDGLGQRIGSGFGYGNNGASFAGTGGKEYCEDDTYYVYDISDSSKLTIGDASMPYDDAVWDDSYGSGSTGAPGGGRLNITTTGNVKLDGQITARGSDAAYHGAGSGGAVVIWASKISGFGTICVSGGNSMSVESGAGGGGRVGLWYLNYKEGDPTLESGSIQIHGGIGHNACGTGGGGTLFQGRVIDRKDMEILISEEAVNRMSQVPCDLLWNPKVTCKSSSQADKVVVLGSLQLDNRNRETYSVTPLESTKVAIHSLAITGGAVAASRFLNISGIDYSMKLQLGIDNDLSINDGGILMPLTLNDKWDDTKLDILAPFIHVNSGGLITSIPSTTTESSSAKRERFSNNDILNESPRDGFTFISDESDAVSITINCLEFSLETLSSMHFKGSVSIFAATQTEGTTGSGAISIRGSFLNGQTATATNIVISGTTIDVSSGGSILAHTIALRASDDIGIVDGMVQVVGVGCFHDESKRMLQLCVDQRENLFNNRRRHGYSDGSNNSIPNSRLNSDDSYYSLIIASPSISIQGAVLGREVVVCGTEVKLDGLIDSSKFGCSGGKGNGAGGAPLNPTASGGGAAYGGAGGDGVQNGKGGLIYGDKAMNVVYSGSGGGSNTGSGGGTGAGVVYIDSDSLYIGTQTRKSDLLPLTATIKANGDFDVSHVPQISRYGGGSGGSIYIRCTSLHGNGAIAAKGGTGGEIGGGAGGGGRIFFKFPSLEVSNITYSGPISVSGGESGEGGNNGDGGTVWSSLQSCPAGAGGIFCYKCPIGTYKQTKSLDQCSKCNPAPTNANFVETGNQSIGSTSPNCAFRCKEPYVGPYCLTAFEELKRVIGRSVLYIIASAATVLPLMLLVTFLFQQFHLCDRIRGEKKLRVPSLLNYPSAKSGNYTHTIDDTILCDYNLPRHLHRIYFSGFNHWTSPWKLCTVTPNIIKPFIHEEQYLTFVTACNASVKWKACGWESIVYNLLTISFLPLAKYFVWWRRNHRAKVLRDVVFDPRYQFLKGMRANALMNDLKFGVSGDRTIVFIDILADKDSSGNATTLSKSSSNTAPRDGSTSTTNIASTATSSSSGGSSTSHKDTKRRIVIGKPVLPLTLVFSGDGSYNCPIHLGTRDVMVRSVPQLSELRGFIDKSWLDFIAALNANLREVNLSYPNVSLRKVIEFVNDINESSVATLRKCGLQVELARYWPNYASNPFTIDQHSINDFSNDGGFLGLLLTAIDVRSDDTTEFDGRRGSIRDIANDIYKKGIIVNNTPSSKLLSVNSDFNNDKFSYFRGVNNNGVSVSSVASRSVFGDSKRLALVSNISSSSMVTSLSSSLLPGNDMVGSRRGTNGASASRSNSYTKPSIRVNTMSNGNSSSSKSIRDTALGTSPSLFLSSRNTKDNDRNSIFESLKKSNYVNPIENLPIAGVVYLPQSNDMLCENISLIEWILWGMLSLVMANKRPLQSRINRISVSFALLCMLFVDLMSIGFMVTAIWCLPIHTNEEININNKATTTCSYTGIVSYFAIYPLCNILSPILGLTWLLLSSHSKARVAAEWNILSILNTISMVFVAPYSPSVLFAYITIMISLFVKICVASLTNYHLATLESVIGGGVGWAGLSRISNSPSLTPRPRLRNTTNNHNISAVDAASNSVGGYSLHRTPNKSRRVIRRQQSPALGNKMSSNIGIMIKNSGKKSSNDNSHSYSSSFRSNIGSLDYRSMASYRKF